ncbi:MAG TPA: methionyl-tRNA formyltransferase [Candidatus Polarisedimenticolia bacterium]|nr:methionyl-tRNA formyltransferase [Candidatus Polarisedimenticolia bacterium]
MRVVFMGTPEFAVPSLDRLAADGHDIPLVVTRPDSRRNRRARPEPSPVKARARALGLEVAEPQSAREPALLERIASLRPDLAVVVAYGKILPAALLEIPSRGAVNVHASLLPRWRGAAPIARAILAGDAVTGVTTMQMELGLDTGPVLLERSCDIAPRETTATLTGRLAVLGADLLAETLPLLARGAITPRPQDESRATWAPPLRREDGRIGWDAPAVEIDRRIRACHPWPVAEAGLRGDRVQILEAEPLEDREPTDQPADACEPGWVLRAGESIVVACGGGTRLAVLTLRVPGGRALSARDAVNGRLVARGECFTAPPG